MSLKNREYISTKLHYDQAEVQDFEVVTYRLPFSFASPYIKDVIRVVPTSGGTSNSTFSGTVKTGHATIFSTLQIILHSVSTANIL